jgi:LAS superfamily LD-carboxypeptidase LdcB
MFLVCTWGGGAPRADLGSPQLEEALVPSHRADAIHGARSRARQRQQSPRRQQQPGRRATHRARGSSLTVQQVGIAGALGLATIAAPISGLMSVPLTEKATANELAAPPAVAAEFPFLPQAPTAVEDLSLVPDDVVVPIVPESLAPPRDLLVTRPSRGQERPVLPGCFGEFPMIKAPNGELPNSMLCTLWDGKHQLRADAAVALAKLNVAYTQQFGHALCISDAYRTLTSQFTVKRQRGYMAATPGRSVHGVGRAVDLCDAMQSSTPTYQWLAGNAQAYGFSNPDWALAGGSGPLEPWHWEFHAQPDTDEELIPGQ